MKTLIYATAAEMGGAITILQEFYEEALASNEYTVFVIGRAKLPSNEKIKIIRIPWIKKLWLFRIVFYFIFLPKIIKREKPDKIISLNNTKVPNKRIQQTIYLHQTLPFYDIKINIISEPYLWSVKYLIGTLIKFSIKRVDKILVQSKWLKEKLINQLNISRENIDIKLPQINTKNLTQFQTAFYNNKLHFFYPAGFVFYKNHQMILDAIGLLSQSEKDKVTVEFTISFNENRSTKKLYKQTLSDKLPIKFIGHQSKNVINKKYSNHILLFPSQIETFGLPLLEARESKTPIICLLSDFSLEILENANKNHIYLVTDANEMSIAIKKLLELEGV